MSAAIVKPKSKAAIVEIMRAESIATILDIIAEDPKPIIYTVARHVSSGGYGTSVDLSLFYIKDNSLWNLTYYASKVLGLKVKSRDGYNIINNIGGGMDLGFDLVYSLSCYLYQGEDRAGYKLSHSWL